MAWQARLHEAMLAKLRSLAPADARRLFSAAAGAAEAEERSGGSGSGCCVGSAPENARWNRYRNVLPWDGTRVRLLRDRGGGGNGGEKYINASYVDLQKSGAVASQDPCAPPAHRARFIATQGPLPETCFDFWEMAVTTQASAVVMLTVGPDVSLESARSPLGPNCADHQLKWQQCAPYFPMDVGQSLQFLEATDEAMPDADPVTAAQVTVTCTSRSDLGGGAVERDMEVRFQESGGSRIQEEDAVFAIKHYQYCAWPDHGVPSDTLGLCAILSRLFWTGADTQSSALSPLYIVHCSAGIGRTGSFLLAWTALEDMFAKQVAEIPDFADLLVKLRRHRGGLVQGSEQFMFSFQLACDALGESIVR